MNDMIRALIREAVGAASFDAAASRITPADGEAVVSAVRVCADTRTPISVGTDAAPPADGIALDLQRIDSVAVDAANLTLRSGAGARADRLRTEAAAHHLDVVGLPPAISPTAGSLVARGTVPRRSVTGVEAVLATGERISAGGGVLKDVVGYDLAGALLGSMGRLAILLEVTFRLEPAGARTPAGAASGAVPELTAIGRAFDPEGLLRPGITIPSRARPDTESTRER